MLCLTSFINAENVIFLWIFEYTESVKQQYLFEHL